MNLATLLVRSASAFPDLTAIAVGGRTVWTYGEFAGRVARLARSLREAHGLRDGDRVGLALSNCPEFFLVLFAAWHAGLAAVPMNFRLHRREFRYILEQSGARLCFVSADLAPALAGLEREVEGLRRVVCVHDEDFARLAAPDRPAMACASVPPDDPAWIFYTSGTTGRPKGATLSHRNLGFMIHAYYADIDTIAPGDANVHAAALSHGAGLYALPSIAQAGMQVICDSPSFDPHEVLARVARHRNVTVWAAPTMLTRLTRAAEAGAADTRPLRTVVYGGGPMYVADLRRSLAVLGPKLVQIFGQGESPMTITSLARDDHLEAHLPTCGRARTLVEVRVVDGDGRGLPAGETGAVTAIQRANSDLRLNPHFHTLFLDGVYAPDRDGKGLTFHPAPAPTQADIEQLVEQVSKRILRYLQRRGVITLVTAPGDGEVTVVPDETLGEKDPLLAKLLAAATTGAAPAGPATKRQPVLIVLDPDDRPVAKGALCAQTRAFNLQAATRVAATEESEKPAGKSKYIPWAELLRRTFSIACRASRLCRLRSFVGGFGNPPGFPSRSTSSAPSAAAPCGSSRSSSRVR